MSATVQFMHSRRKKQILLALTAGILTSLSGCTSLPAFVERSYEGAPTETHAPKATPLPNMTPKASGDLPDPDLGPRAQWTATPGVFALSLWGSSSCPVEPVTMDAVSMIALP